MKFSQFHEDNYELYWNIIKDKLNPEPWRYELALKGDFKAAVFGYETRLNPMSSNMYKDDQEYEWEQKVWKTIEDVKSKIK